MTGIMTVFPQQNGFPPEPCSHKLWHKCSAAAHSLLKHDQKQLIFFKWDTVPLQDYAFRHLKIGLVFRPDICKDLFETSQSACLLQFDGLLCITSDWNWLSFLWKTVPYCRSTNVDISDAFVLVAKSPRQWSEELHVMNYLIMATRSSIKDVVPGPLSGGTMQSYRFGFRVHLL